MLETALYVYEFNVANFYLQDKSAGFFVSERTEEPISVTKYDDLYNELFNRNVEVRVMGYLWDLGRSVQKSSLHWSLCRMANALPENKA